MKMVTQARWQAPRVLPRVVVELVVSLLPRNRTRRGDRPHSAIDRAHRHSACSCLDDLIDFFSGIEAGVCAVPSVYPHVRGLGRQGPGFRLARKAYEERSDVMTVLAEERAFDPLRSDPRFQDLLRRVGLPR